MLDEVKAWGLKPETVTGDSWYAAKETMNTLKDKGFRGLFAPHRKFGSETPPFYGGFNFFARRFSFSEGFFQYTAIEGNLH